MAAMLERSNKRQKTSNTRNFWMPADFDASDMEVYLGKHYSGSDMPMIKDVGQDPRYVNKTIVSCYTSTIYSNMGPNADQGTCNGMITEPQHFTVDLTKHLPEWFENMVPGSQERLNTMFEVIPLLVDSMWNKAWETEDLMIKHKEKARKEAKKMVKKEGGDLEEVAKKEFIKNGTLSLLKEYTDEDGEEQPRIHLRRKYASKTGMVMRPTIWRKDKETGKMKDITEEVAFIPKNSIVKVDFQLNMYDLPQKYGIQGQLGRNCVVVYMENYKKTDTTEEALNDIPVIDF
jgi:hypothetical protein